MNRDLYSNHDFEDIKKRINLEIKRRGTWSWWGPLVPPSIGIDRTSPRTIPDGDMRITNKTYTVNNPSEGSLEPTRDRVLNKMGSNPSGEEYKFISSAPNTSAAHFTAEEMRNILIGLSRIRDICNYFGRDEKANTVYRDPQPILDVLELAERDQLNRVKKLNVYFRFNEDDELQLVYDDEFVEDAWVDGDEIHIEFKVDELTEEEIQFFNDLGMRVEDGELIVEHPDNVNMSGLEMVDGNLVMTDPPNTDNRFRNIKFQVTEDGSLYAEQLVDPVTLDLFIIQDGLTEKEIEFFNSLQFTVENNELIFTAPDGVDADAFHIDGNDLIMETDDAILEKSFRHIRFHIGSDGELVAEQNGQIGDIDTNTLDDSLYMKFDQYNFNYRRDNPPPYELDGNTVVMPSGERDGEETIDWKGLSRTNFFDDYGAEPGDSNFHPFNKGVTPKTRRDQDLQDNNRNLNRKVVKEGGVRTSSYGQNPRNPNSGNPYRGRPVYEGVPGSCIGACTGLCYVTCDDECSESCRTTCWSTCGNACTASCGNVCTGCSTLCLSSCRTKCENTTGYSCVRAGAKTLRITTVGGLNPRNSMRASTYSCEGCSFSCQFYPNKKTECWDAGCMGKCFTSCLNACLDSCTGGCINNAGEEGTDYKTGKGRGCSSGCTMNCIGDCRGVCEGSCVHTCFSGCKQMCTDNCEWTCTTICSTDCSNGCTRGCTGCAEGCKTDCLGEVVSNTCTGCSSSGGCVSTCQHDCASNCIGAACKSLCGTDSAGSCTDNCRISCASTSCTALCSDACSSLCVSCVQTCGYQCGVCTSSCSSGCESACNVTCTEVCEHSCETNCVQSCSEACGGCSGLCYSCVSMCIGVCSLRCENGCSHGCDTSCEQWCDQSCSQECFVSCTIYCIRSCSGSCITRLSSEPGQGSKLVLRSGYPNPENRAEEQEAFNIIKE